MLYHAGPRSLVFFAECLKIITDSVSLLTGARSSSLGNSFWTSLTVFGVFCYFQTRVTCRPKSRCQSDLSTVSVLANKNLHQDLMHSGCRGTAVPKACPQAFSLFPLPNSLLDQRPVHGLIFCSTENHSYNKQPLQPSHVNRYSLIQVPATVFTVEKRMVIRFGTKVMIGIRPNDPWRVQGQPTSIFEKYLFGRWFKI